MSLRLVEPRKDEAPVPEERKDRFGRVVDILPTKVPVFLDRTSVRRDTWLLLKRAVNRRELIRWGLEGKPIFTAPRSPRSCA